MKKILAILLTLILMVGLCACGSNGDTSIETQTPPENTTSGTQNSTDTPTETESSNTSTTNPETNNTENVNLFDKNGVLIYQEPVVQKYTLVETPTFKDNYVEATIKSVEVTNESLVVVYTVKNLSQYTLACNAKSFELEGYTIEFDTRTNDTIAEKIEPKETVERTLTIDKNTLKECDFKYILNGVVNVGFSAHYSNSDECDYRNRIALSFKTNCDKKNVLYTDGVVAYDKDGIKAVVQYTGRCNGEIDVLDSNVKMIRILIINNTEKVYAVKINEILVNGDLALSIYPDKQITHTVQVNPGNSAYCLYHTKNTESVRKALTTQEIKNFNVKFVIQNEYGTKEIPAEATVNTK